jgi:predicted small lipoprotein YifL
MRSLLRPLALLVVPLLALTACGQLVPKLSKAVDGDPATNA